MQKLTTSACALLCVLVLPACASKATSVQAPPIVCPKPPPPAAWSLQAPRLMQTFNNVFSISGELSETPSTK